MGSASRMAVAGMPYDFVGPMCFRSDFLDFVPADLTWRTSPAGGSPLGLLCLVSVVAEVQLTTLQMLISVIHTNFLFKVITYAK